MRQKAIKKSIDIQAPKEKVWDVLLNDKYNRIWFAVFSEGTHAVTDWQVGSKVVFIDKSQGGMIGNVIANQPSELLSVEYQGVVEDGKEVYDSEMAQAVKGGREIYQLSENEGSTHLSIESDMGEEYFESMSAAWDKALEKVKDLAEAK